MAKKENLYRKLQATMGKIPKGDIKVLMGGMNAKIGADNTARELIMDRVDTHPVK